MFDETGFEFIFRQPANVLELENLIEAAYMDPFQGYASDGNKKWTLSLIRAWWKTCDDLLSETEYLRIYDQNVEVWQAWITGPAIEYLRQYAFFVEEGQLPKIRDHLPRL